MFICGGNKSPRSTVIELFTRTYLERRIMLLLMLHPLFPALIACFPASVLMSLVMDQISIAMSTSITIFCRPLLIIAVCVFITLESDSATDALPD